MLRVASTFASSTKSDYLIRKNGKMSRSQTHVPVEITEQILRRLRVKDLLKFRSVCKAWKTLIDSHSFKLTHFKSAADTSLLIWRRDTSPDDTIERHFLHFLSPRHDSYKASFAFPPIDDSAKKIIPPIFSCYTPNIESYEQFGVVNGLVCLECEGCMLIWNPSTRQFRAINPPGRLWVTPLVEQCKSLGEGELVINDPVCAFGFDPKTEDHKFLIARFTNRGKVVVMLYSMRKDCWSSPLVDFPYLVFVRNADGFLDGCFYWFAKLCYKTDVPLTRAIVKFDFNRESFDFIQLSEELTGAAYEKSVVVTTRGCLELITTTVGDKKSRHCEVWGMGDDGMWSRKLRFRLSREFGSPLGITKDGQMICAFCGPGSGRRVVKKISLLNPATGWCKILGDDSDQFLVLTFGESLFSIQ